MFVPSPIHNVHGWHDDRLRTQTNQPVGYPGITQVVTNADANFSPGRLPKLLFRRGQPVLEELDGHALDLAKNDLAHRPDHESSVIKVGLGRQILATNDQVALMMAAPCLYRLSNRS